MFMAVVWSDSINIFKYKIFIVVWCNLSSQKIHYNFISKLDHTTMGMFAVEEFDTWDHITAINIIENIYVGAHPENVISNRAQITIHLISGGST